MSRPGHMRLSGLFKSAQRWTYPQGFRQTRPQRLSCSQVVREAEVTSDYMLEQTNCLRLDELGDHVTEHGANCIEAFVGLADVGKAHLVEEDFLDDEYGDRLAEFRAGLHDAQTEGYDLGAEQEVDDIRVVVLFDQGPDHPERGEAEVLERPGLGGRVEERVQEERDVRLQEERASIVVRCNTLQQGKGVAYPV